MLLLFASKYKEKYLLVIHKQMAGYYINYLGNHFSTQKIMDNLFYIPGTLHRDLHLCNVLWDSGWRNQPYVSDKDSAVVFILGIWSYGCHECYPRRRRCVLVQCKCYSVTCSECYCLNNNLIRKFTPQICNCFLTVHFLYGW